MAIQRTIYTQGFVTVVDPIENDGIGDPTPLFAQSISWSHNTPKESLTALGRTSFQRVSSASETVSLEVTIYPTGSEGNLLDHLTKGALAIIPSGTSIRTNLGGLDGALLSSVKGEASVGSIPSVTLSFIGRYAVSGAPIDSSTSPITTIRTTEQVGVSASGCAQKASFSWDLPIEPMSCLGSIISTGAEFFGNPPGSASISVEGTTDPNFVNQVDIGNFTFKLGDPDRPAGTGATIASRSNNLAVGQINGTFNTVTEGLAIDCIFSEG